MTEWIVVDRAGVTHRIEQPNYRITDGGELFFYEGPAWASGEWRTVQRARRRLCPECLGVVDTTTVSHWILLPKGGMMICRGVE